MTERAQITSTAVAVLVVFATVASVTVVGAGALAAGTQTASANHDSPGNYTVVLPDESDHQTGDENPEGASIQHFAALEGSFEDAPANRYEVLEWLVISSPELDFGGCETEDTSAFGIDRGNNNEGTQYDDDLLQHRKDSAFLDNKIWVQFYNDDDFGGNTVGINEEDAIVAVQNSCYTMPEEPGWYQINGKINGTGPNGEFFETSLVSHYFPVCDGCHDEETAEEKLGPPPSQQDSSGDESTPTPEPDTPEPTDSDDSDSDTGGADTATPEPDDSDGDTGGEDTATPESDDTGGDTGGEDTATPASDDSDGDAGGASGDADDNATPTPGDGPGFTAITALLALLASALLVRRQ